MIPLLIAYIIDYLAIRLEQIGGKAVVLPPNPLRLLGIHSLISPDMVDEKLRTDQPDIFAAGDVAEFNQPILGKRLRVEHEDNANMMGKQTGRNMTGANEPYRHLSYFYSDLFELGYEAVGELDPHMETIMDWQDTFKKGVIYYMTAGRVRGVLLWNVWDTVPAARALIDEPGPFNTADLKNRLP